MAVTFLLFFYTQAFSQVPQHFELYGIKNEAQLQRAKSWKFDQVILENAQLVAPAEKLGMRVVQANWWNKDTPMEAVNRQIDAAKKIKNLVSVNMADEPFHNGIDKYPAPWFQQIYAQSKTRNPGVALSLTLDPPSHEWQTLLLRNYIEYLKAVDSVRIDPYPVINYRPLREVYDSIQQLRK
jgi:hypothetical protein